MEKQRASHSRPPTFSSLEVSKMTGVGLRQLQWWDKQGVVSPIQRGHRSIYQLHNVIEVALITELRRKGLSLQRIRKVLKFLNKELGARLTSTIRGEEEVHLLTDGKTLYLESSYLGIVNILKNASQPLISVCITDLVERVASRTPAAEPKKCKTPAGKAVADAPRPIMEEIQRVIPEHEEWLNAPNPILLGSKPSKLIEEGNEEPIRELLWSVVHVGVS